MALTVNAKAYTADGYDKDSVRFQGPAHTVSAKDRLVQRKSDPKPSALYSGNARYNVKLTRTHTLTGAKTPTGDGFAQLDFQLPVGMPSADVDAYCADLGAYIATAGFKAALKAGQTNG
jgi:hypothetical protein